MRAPAESTRYRRGTRRLAAASWMRRIFSTVFGPHEPALTVGSLARKQTRRPWILPIPVTTASAGLPSSVASANTPSSTPKPGSRSCAKRSRTNSRPSALARWRYRSGPPCSICSILAINSSSRLMARSLLTPWSFELKQDASLVDEFPFAHVHRLHPTTSLRLDRDLHLHGFQDHHVLAHCHRIPFPHQQARDRSSHR